MVKAEGVVAPLDRQGWAFEAGRHLWMPYCQMKTAFPPHWVERTEGDEIFLRDGRGLVDAIASWWTACHGYNHPVLVEAVVAQARKLPHVMFAGLCHEQAEQLSRRLAGLLPGDLNRVFLCDTGSVAVEVSLKVAVQYWLNQGQKQRHKFVCFKHSYHGDTTGAMSVCDPVDSMHAHFKGFLLEQFPVALPLRGEELAKFDAFLSQNKQQIAGVIIEPLAQMAAGVRLHTPQTLRDLFEICRRHELLFIADEIATGFGRTGSMFAMEQANICPDIVCLGKALTGGMLTLAATVVRDYVYDVFHADTAEFALMHGPTYMGNPLACAAANASLDLFEREPRLQQVKEICGVFEQAAGDIGRCSHVTSARSLGAILAVSFDQDLPRDKTTAWFVNHGIWLRPIRNVVYACPPFTISQAHLDRLVHAMRRFCESAPADLP